MIDMQPDSTAATAKPAPPLDMPFHEAAQRVSRRLFVKRWLEALDRSALWVLGAGVVVCLGLWLAGVSVSGVEAVTIAWSCIGAWAVGSAIWAAATNPGPTAALAYWDSQSNRAEMFISAYCFEEQAPAEQTQGQQLHLQRARKVLHDAGDDFYRAAPAVVTLRSWAAPCLLIALVGAGFFETSAAREARLLDEAAQARAAEVAADLEEQAEDFEDPKSLTPEEKQKLEEIKKAIAETASKMQQAGSQSQEQMLRELESRARDAEKLAQAMGQAAGDPQASPLLKELAKHADTADFAEAMRAEKLADAAGEARKLAGRLQRNDLPIEEQQRIENALDAGLKKADNQDKRTPTGKQADKARKDLGEKKPKQAGERFKNLAGQLDRQNQRNQAMQRLQQLAQQLRNAGQRLAGRRGGQMRQLANLPNAPQGLRRLGGQQGDGRMPLPRGPMQPGLMNPNAPMAQGQPMGPNAIPGGIPPGMIPPPGGPMPGGMPGLMPPVPGIPMPGMGQGQGRGQGMGQGMSMIPVPGQGGGLGGLRAGHGSAGYANNRTNPTRPADTSTVNARLNQGGESVLRDVESPNRREDVREQTRAMAIQFINAQEEALDAEPIPLSRREQVLRYFTAVRRQLEQQP